MNSYNVIPENAFLTVKSWRRKWKTKKVAFLPFLYRFISDTLQSLFPKKRKIDIALTRTHCCFDYFVINGNKFDGRAPAAPQRRAQHAYPTLTRQLSLNTQINSFSLPLTLTNQIDRLIRLLSTFIRSSRRVSMI